MTDACIKEYLERVEDDLTQLRDNRFYGSVTHTFEIKGGKIVELQSTLDKKFRRTADLQKGVR